jgi:hypothetical protein
MHEQQFRKELELRSDQTRTVQENILPDCLTVDRSREGLSAGDAVDHPEEKRDTEILKVINPSHAKIRIMFS